MLNTYASRLDGAPVGRVACTSKPPKKRKKKANQSHLDAMQRAKVAKKAASKEANKK